jgi:Cupin domain
MAAELPPVRRIVTARRADGTSYVAEDGSAPAVKTVTARPGYRAVNAWLTRATPCEPDAPDETLRHEGILPPKNGTILRIIDFPPEPADPEERRRQMAATFQTIYRDVDHTRRADKHPGVHTTETIDYAIVLSGEIYALLDDGEHLMKAGDVLIQRATRHGWGNRSDKPCRIAFVLIDGSR